MPALREDAVLTPFLGGSVYTFGLYAAAGLLLAAAALGLLGRKVKLPAGTAPPRGVAQPTIDRHAATETSATETMRRGVLMAADSTRAVRPPQHVTPGSPRGACRRPRDGGS